MIRRKGVKTPAIALDGLALERSFASVRHRRAIKSTLAKPIEPAELIETVASLAEHANAV